MGQSRRAYRVLLIGGSGRLGTAIARQWTDCEIIAPSHAQLDLENGEQLREAVERLRPDMLVSAAAFHDVDRCEEEPERAVAVNAFAVGRAARIARERDLLFVTISTDYVFDGETSEPYREDATAHPLSIYGFSKLLGEHLAQRYGGRVFVVRTCGLYGDSSSSTRPSLLDRALSQSTASPPLRVVDDVVASPTFSADLAVAIRALVETREYGLYHAVNAGAVSWYEFASEALRLAGRQQRIEPISAGQRESAAVRPRFSALENAKLRALRITMPSWRDGIAAYLGLQVR
jgi:dTDP-4-dehydrorhamnose reductase